jgi:hypothetical protein
MTRAPQRVPDVLAVLRSGSLLKPNAITIVSNRKASGSSGRQFIHAEHAGNRGARYAGSDASDYGRRDVLGTGRSGCRGYADQVDSTFA